MGEPSLAEGIVRKQGKKLVIASVIVLTVGLVLSVLEDLLPPTNLEWLNFLLSLTSEVGFALIIAGVIALIFEPILAREREENIAKSIGGQLHEYQRMLEAGFRAIYPNRQEVFNRLLSRSLREAKKEIKVLGICVSLFKEIEGRPHLRRSPIEPISFFANLIERGVSIRVLMLARSPTREQFVSYGLKEADFYWMRERDEDYDPGFWQGKRLRRIADRSMSQWLQVLLYLANLKSSDTMENRREILMRLQVREYLALPSISLYVIDSQIYVTPYLYKRHCSDVPAFLLQGASTDLFRTYDAHFEELWRNESPPTVEAFPSTFVKLLAEEPTETIKEFNQILEKLKTKHSKRCDQDPESELEAFRFHELAMIRLLEQRAI